jgi:enterobactin synthetase component F
LYGVAELDEHRRRLLRLIEQVLANPSTPLRELDILGDKERQRLLLEWNDTAAAVPDISVPKLVEQWAAATPEAPAIVFGDTAVSYRELQERSLRQARSLRAHGVQPGDIVAVALPRSEQLLVVLLAIMRAGAAYLPLELDSPNDRIALMLEDASPKVLIAEPQMQARFGSSFTLLQPECGEALPDGKEPEPDLSTPDSVAYVLYTSGSTGRPKGVEITHRNLGNFLHGMQEQLSPASNDRFLAVTTVIFDIAGLELYLPLMVGARVVMASNEALHNPRALARLIRHSGATHVQATPSLWRVLLSSSETRLNGVHALVGGEALSAELAARLKSMAARVTQFYGPTETTVWSTAFELEEVGTGAPPIGRPILNTRLYVLDENRRPVVTGGIGELYIGGAGVAKGYLKRPELTAERFVADPFASDGSRMYRTGDLVRWSDAGLLEFIGRADGQVKINGHRIELGEIESLLLEHPSIAEAAVAAHRDADSIPSLAAYVVAERGCVVEMDALRGFLSGRVPTYMMPSSFMLLDVMPLTPNGKLDRKSLAVPQRVGRMEYAEPVTPVEKKLAALWQEILKVERVGLHDNFFELGGDSLTAAVMSALFPEHLDVELPLGSVFEAPTIADLAVLVERLGSASLDPIGVMLTLRTVSKNAHRPLFCIHPMAGISMGFSSLLRHLDPSMPVYALQSRGLRSSEQLPDSIEQIAADYLTEMRHVQPDGPYRLVGRSLGGLIGHAIVERMQAQGLEVEMLAMIDSYLFMGGERGGLRSEAEEVRAVMSFLNTHPLGENTPRTLKELAGVLVRTYDPHSIPLFQEIIRSNPQFIQNLCAVMINHLALARKYVPGKIDVDLLYFQAMQKKGDLDGIVDRSPSAWRSFIGGRIEVHELACHHEGVLDPVPAAQIGNTLRQWFSMPRLQRTPMGSSLIRSATGEMSVA